MRCILSERLFQNADRFQQQGFGRLGIIHSKEILSYLDGGTLEGMYQPLLLHLTCYCVLQANADPRAPAVLEEGYQLLCEIAGKFTNENLRRSFLENVATHRELAQEYGPVQGL